jgi:hypothetical protein
MTQQQNRFEFDVQGSSPQRWTWHCVDADTGSILKLSKQAFETLYACIKDAEKHGYTPPVVQLRA